MGGVNPPLARQEPMDRLPYSCLQSSILMHMEIKASKDLGNSFVVNSRFWAGPDWLQLGEMKGVMDLHIVR